VPTTTPSQRRNNHLESSTYGFFVGVLGRRTEVIAFHYGNSPQASGKSGRNPVARKSGFLSPRNFHQNQMPVHA
jgi:hypothetical protein